MITSDNDLDRPNPTIEKDGEANRGIAGGIIAFILLVAIPVPLVLLGPDLDHIAVPLGLLMASGPFLACLWLLVTGEFTGAAKAAIVTLATGIAATLVAQIGDRSWYSYDPFFVKGGWVLGIIAVIAYAVAIRFILSQKWLIWMIVAMVVSLAAPWLWAGFAAYAANHAL